MRNFFSLVLALLPLTISATGAVSIDLDLQEQKAYLLRNGRAVSESPIASGRPGYETPTGTFKVLQKDLNHNSSLYGKIVDASGNTVVADADADMPVPKGGRFVQAPMKYFIRFTGGTGTHAGVLPGYAASHGCVRMPREKAAQFFEAVEVGSTVRVYGKAPRRGSRQNRPREQFEPPSREMSQPSRRRTFPWFRRQDTEW